MKILKRTALLMVLVLSIGCLTACSSDTVNDVEETIEDEVSTVIDDSDTMN